MNNSGINDSIGLIDSCIELIEWIKKLASNKINETLIFLKEVENALIFIESMDVINSYIIKLYCNNIKFSISKIEINNQIKQKIIELEILPLLYEIRKIIINNQSLCNDTKANNHQKRECLFHNYSKRPINSSYKYNVSIVFTAYNKLEYTKKAIESIYKYTDFSKLNVELITINNGSTDGTEEYLNSLPNEKKINFKYNMLGNTSYMHNIEGEYWVGFSNDVIATPNWLENLLICIKSDKNNVYVVPTCNSNGISCNQGVDIEYENDFSSIYEIERFALKYNKSNPRLWEERIVLMPFVAIVDTELTMLFLNNDVDLFDSNTYKMHEFIDDDFSTSLRRAGLKQILAKDTFMHHFGSVTLKDERKNGSLENMREVYYKKWGVDAWDSRGEVEGFEELLKYDIYDNPKILFIEPKFGVNTLNIKKILRDKGIKVSKMVAAIFDRRYLPDARYMYDQIIAVNSTKEIIEDEEKYSLISFGTYINEIEKEDIIAFLESLYHKLENKGQIIFTIKNFRNAKIIFDLLTNNPLEVCGYEKIDFHGCDFDRLFERLSQNELLSSFEVHAIYNHDKEVDVILSLDDSINKMTASAIDRLKNEIGTKYYTFVINKNG